MILDVIPEKIYDLNADGGLFAIYYDPEDNTFYQEGGWPVHDIYNYITPSESFLFRTKCDDMLIKNNKHDFFIGLFYPILD